MVSLDGLRAMPAYDRATLAAYVTGLLAESDRIREALEAARTRRGAAEQQLAAAANLGDELAEMVLERQHEIAQRRAAVERDIESILADARRDADHIRTQAADDAAALRAALDDIVGPASEQPQLGAEPVESVIDLSAETRHAESGLYEAR